MTRNQDDQGRIRLYLLRQLPDDQWENIEQRLLTDNEFFEELELAEAELCQEYAAGELSEKDRHSFEQTLLANPELNRKLSFARALERYVSKAKLPAVDDKPWRFSLLKWLRQPLPASPLAVAVAILVVITIGFSVWRLGFYQSDVDKGLVALNAAYREQRPVEARISKLEYAPYSATRAPGTDKVDQNELRRAELILLDAAKKNPTPAAHHALGKVYLAKREFDKAIKEFEEALKGDSKNAQYYSDLGAAWLEKARIDRSGPEPGKGTAELGRSLEDLSKALDLDQGFLEARFNRALCYQLMLLPRQAEEDWREYLKKDSSSPWAQEAARNLKLLQEQKNNSSESKEKLLQNFLSAYESRDDQSAWLILSRQRDLSGGLIANALIDGYLDLAGKDQHEESLKKLDVLFYAAKLEQKNAGDLFVLDVARFLKSASPRQRNSLGEARQLLKLGRQGLLDSKLDLAAENLNHAKSIFDDIGDKAEALYVEYPIGHSHLLQAKSNLGLVAFDRVVRESEARHYRWLEAQALNATANAQIGLTNHSAALEASQRSLELSKEIGDTTGVIKTTNQLAQEYFRLGNYPKSLEFHEQSLVFANATTPEPIQLWRNYFTIAMPLNAMGLHSAAIEYEKEALRQAEVLKNPLAVCRSYAILGLMHAGRGDYTEALRNADVAIEMAKKISSPTAQKEAIAYSSLQRGLIHRQAADFGKALVDYDRAIQLYGELDKFQAFSYVAHKGKLLSCLRQEGCGSVEEEIKICLELFEQYRSKILEESNREPFFDTEQDIYDVAIDYEFSRKHYETAFEYSERARARSLLDLTSNEAKLIGSSSEPDIRFDSAMAAKEFAELKPALPPEAQVIQYGVMKDKLVIWLISNTEFVHEERAVPLADLNEIILRYLKLVSSPSGSLDGLTRDGSALYDILIKPVERSLKKDKLLCIVPDKTLNYLPFGSLISTGSGKYLMNEYRLVLAPSTTMFIHSSKLAAEKKKLEIERLLAVGNPLFNRAQFPLLGDLPSAAREAQKIKESYGRSRSLALIGEDATKTLVEAEMKRSDVIHLALHSIVDEESPLRSELVLAAGGVRADLNETGVLQAYEIYGSRLPVTRLVVLSACETGVGRYYRGEGIMGLSRTFIAAGVPLVVASLWRVDSDSTADLMIAFHRHRKTDNLSTAEALQKAQMDVANGADPRYRHPYYWAAFTLFGGYAKF